jgi:hypothetical protein
MLDVELVRAGVRKAELDVDAQKVAASRSPRRKLGKAGATIGIAV